MQQVNLRPKIEIYAKVTRKDGTVEDLGCISTTEDISIGQGIKKLLKKMKIIGGKQNG